MSLAVVGISHHTAPIEVRERFVFSPRAGAEALVRLTREGVGEAVMLSTCNRTEIYIYTAGEGGGGGEGEGNAGEKAGEGRIEQTIELLARQAGYTIEEARRYLYVHGGRNAAEHLFRVVTSLDSMVLGEAQIQGQVRAAYEQAAAEPPPKVVGPVLARLFQTALSVGGRVRSETALGVGAASVPSAAIELAKKVFGSLKGRRALVLGAGEMSELALECLTAEGVRTLVVANRTEERARELAERVGGTSVRFDELPAQLPTTDIIIAATSAPHPVLTRELVERALPGGPRHPLFIVDIALPRDVEPAVDSIENVFLYDIDDLYQVVDESLERRRAEVPAAERIVAQGVDDFWRWYAGLQVVPVIQALRQRAEAVRRTEVEHALRRLAHLAPGDREAIEVLTRQLLNKVLHEPTVRLKEAAADGNAEEVLEMARFLFELGEEKGG